jgi:hypothetical protein
MFGRVARYVVANSLDVVLDLHELLREEDSHRFSSVWAHVLLTSFPFLDHSFWATLGKTIVNLVREIHGKLWVEVAENVT